MLQAIPQSEHIERITDSVPGRLMKKELDIIIIEDVAGDAEEK